MTEDLEDEKKFLNKSTTTDINRGVELLLRNRRRSLAYTLRFQATDRTLTDKEISEVRERCISAVEKELAASLRS